MRLNKDAALNLGSLQDQLSWFQSEKLVKSDIKIEQIVDQSYVKILGA